MSREASTLSLTPAEEVAPGKRFPVVEIFGPTVQGEGRMVGAPCNFVRFGGCDYRCSWCDTPFAVLPDQVRKNSVKMGAEDIQKAIEALPGVADWVILSGGNPALHPLTNLIENLQYSGKKIAVETQGSIYQSWFDQVDLLTLSPKPPSSGMETRWDTLQFIYEKRRRVGLPMDIKVVAFDDKDLEYCREVFRRFPATELDLTVRHFISTGTFVGVSSRDDILDRMRDFVEEGLKDPILGRVTYSCQFHVLLWSHRRGV